MDKVKMKEISDRMDRARTQLGELMSAETTAEVTEKRALLVKDYGTAEKEWREAMLAAETPDGEVAERAALRNKIEVRHYLQAAARTRPLQGAEKEYNESLGLRSDGAHLPWAGLLPPAGGGTEKRADTASVVADGANIPRQQDLILGRVFAGSIIEYLHCRVEMAGVGESVHPVLTAGADAEPRPVGDRVDAGAATITTQLVGPRRLTARYLLRIEDTARLMGYEDTLRMDLHATIDNQMSNLVLNGVGAGAQPSGYLHALGARPAVRDIQVHTTAGYLSDLSGSVDGLYAHQTMDVRLLYSVPAYRKLANLFRDGSSNMLLAEMMSTSGGIKTSAHFPAAQANISDGIAIRTGAGRVNSVCVTWPSIELIRDPYTRAAEGEVALTAIVLWNFLMIRTDGFRRLTVKTE